MCLAQAVTVTTIFDVNCGHKISSFCNTGSYNSNIRHVTSFYKKREKVSCGMKCTEKSKESDYEKVLTLLVRER